MSVFFMSAWPYVLPVFVVLAVCAYRPSLQRESRGLIQYWSTATPDRLIDDTVTKVGIFAHSLFTFGSLVLLTCGIPVAIFWIGTTLRQEAEKDAYESRQVATLSSGQWHPRGTGEQHPVSKHPRRRRR